MTECTNHSKRRANDVCRACGLPCCEDCLVFSFGRLRDPYCVACALVASGVHPAVRAEVVAESP